MSKTAQTNLPPQTIQRISRYGLAVILGGLFAVGVINLWDHFGPSSIRLEPIPFGATPGTKIILGIEPEFQQELARYSPTSLQEWQRARELSERGNWKAAGEVFGALTLQYPNLAPGIYRAAQAVLNQNDELDPTSLAAVETYLRSLENLHPNHPSTLYLRALLGVRQGNILPSLELLRKTLLQAPRHLDARALLANLLLNEEQFARAGEEARLGISLSNGEDPRFFALLAQSHHDRGVLDSCQQVLEYSTAKFPHFPHLLVLSGYLREYAGDFGYAERLYRQALALENNHLQARQALRTLGEKSPPGGAGSGNLTPRHRAQLALEILEPLVLQYPQNLPLRHALGQAFLKARMFDRAREQFETIAGADPEYPDIRLRIQESRATAMEYQKDSEIAESLKRGVDSLRTNRGHTRSTSEKLGHYLVRWGASPREFFARYPMQSFRRIDTLVWRENYYEEPLIHQYTVRFDSTGLYAVHVLIRDSLWSPRNRGSVVYDLYGRMLGVNSRISGIGNSTGESTCPDNQNFQGAIWETRDNFELLGQFSEERNQVRMIRLAPTHLPDIARLCNFVPWLKLY